MGRDKKQERSSGPRRQELTHRPMMEQLLGVSVNPDCLVCKKPIIHVDRQSQGYMHDACEKKVVCTEERLFQQACLAGHVEIPNDMLLVQAPTGRTVQGSVSP